MSADHTSSPLKIREEKREEMREEEFVAAMLQKYKIINYRDLFEKKQYSKANMPKQLDYLIKPFTLTEEQQKLKSGLLEISQSSAQNRIELLSSDCTNFQIQPLKSNKTFAYNFDITSTLDKGKKLSSKRKQAVVALSTSEDETKKKKVERKKKGAQGKDDSILLPQVLQPILQSIFDEFWNLEMEPEIALPFFSTISRDNCARLGMPDFYEKVTQECTFADMKEKLTQGHYSQPYQFENDFNLLIKNVTTYFPSTAGAHQKALELKYLFDSKWNLTFPQTLSS